MAWYDEDTGWTGRVSIWLPTSDDPDFVTGGLTVVSSDLGHNGYDEPLHKVAMLNKAVSTPIYTGFFPNDVAHVLKFGWPLFNGQNPWQPNLFYKPGNGIVYAPFWKYFK